jgi:hypothetical protein
LFKFEPTGGEILIREEGHYRIVTDKNPMDKEVAGDRLSRMEA